MGSAIHLYEEKDYLFFISFVAVVFIDTILKKYYESTSFVLKIYSRIKFFSNQFIFKCL